MRKKFFTMRVVRHLPREAVDASFLEMFQGQVGWSFEQHDLVEGVPAHGKSIRDRQSFNSNESYSTVSHPK